MGGRFRLAAAGLLAVALLAGTFVPGGSVKASQPITSPPRTLILLNRDADLDAVADIIRESGGRIVHVFPPSALIAELPDGIPLPAGVHAAYGHKISESTMVSLGDDVRTAVETWNHLVGTPSSDTTTTNSEELQARLVGDALVPPSRSSVGTSAQTSEDPTPSVTQSSEFLIGRVAVGIVLPESDGTAERSTEDWTEKERSRVMSEVASALDWWAAREPRANLTFVYDESADEPATTSYEPINHPYTDQYLWIREVMEQKGYTGSSYFDQVYQYNDGLRKTYGTDWAFTIFVVDSSSDNDDCFADGYFAYAYTGGPYTVLTYGNAGYGIQNLDTVAAHEIGHIFYALDQYEGARQPCTRRSGYLGVDNQNSQYGDCTSDEASIMRGHIEPFAAGAVDSYARGQLGWRDSDGDGVLDPIDTTITLSNVQVTTDVTHSNVFTLTGTARDDPYPSPLRPSVTINAIETVQYRVSGGDWIAAQPADGDFNSFAEDFHFRTAPLPTGDHDVELRVVDSAGNVLTETLATVSAVDPVDAILDTTLTRAAAESADAEPASITYEGQGASTTSYIASIHYRIDAAVWEPITPDDGVFDEAHEEFHFTITPDALSPGMHEVEVYSVDGEGNVETSPATDTFRTPQRAVIMFFPLAFKGLQLFR
ncbi:MAG: hypothetical protein PVF54_06500 [Anaerolineae bacterium]